MSKAKMSITQLRLPLITYYVTVVDPVAGTTVSVVDHDTWQATVRQYRDHIERIEHKAFGSGLVANLVLRGEGHGGKVGTP